MPTVLAMIEIDLHSPVPSYRQLADILRERIESGEIGPREALPSITFLVQETGLAVNTVRHAIRVLADEGFVYVIPGRGTFATPKGQRP
jgi:DNA-binding GntR family transcriptional regulator